MSVPELHWERHPGNGPPLLMVHGFLSSRAQWLPNLAALAEVSTPIVVELWGHGRSPGPEDPDLYTPASYVEAFEGIRRAVGVERWLVCGCSLGAGLTIGYTIDHPERVIAQVFTNSTSGFADPAQTAAWREGAEQSARTILEKGREAIERIPVHPRFAKRLPETVREPLVTDAAGVDALGIANTIRYTNPTVSVRARIDRNTVPALLTCGRNERRFQAHRDFAAQNMPHLEIVDLDAGHAVNMEAPDPFNAAVTDFLRRHSRA